MKRYNAVVERLEVIEALPVGMFPKLEEDANFGQLGAEATLLSGYLKDMVEEEAELVFGGPPTKGPDLGPLVALAPFLGSKELSQLVRERFPRAKVAGQDEDEGSEATLPDLKTIVSLAPHMKSADLADLLRSYIGRNGNIDPKYIAALAPHMNSEQLGQMLRNSVPDWFGATPRPAPSPQPAPNPAPAPEEKSVDWMKDLNNPNPV